MLVSIEMYPIHPARRRHATGIEEVTRQVGTDLAINLSQACAPFLRSGKLGGNWSLRATNWRRAYQKDRREGHPRLDGGLPDLFYKSGRALTCRPGVVVGMTKLKIIRSQHQDHKSEWRLRLDPLGQALNSVAPRFERIFPDRPAPVQAIFRNSDGLAEIIQFLLENAWPAGFKRKASSRVWDDSPGQGVGVNENVEHVAILTGRLVAGDW